ncbi:MAG: tetratricopeptide repeat protein [Thermomonas sp.]|uniref:tetratricopeptide repeat protein n=1 Tax=Thermomonas sp. TaxID=1971895 RepID=UPI0039E4F851
MVTLLLAALLAAQSAPPQPTVAAPTPIAKVMAAPAIPPAPETVMAVPPELRAIVQQRVIDASVSRQKRLERLAALMFDADGLGIEYEASATHTVAEVFQTRKANCLTFTLLAIALAREVGLEAFPQEIERTLTWDTDDGNVFVQNMHVNAGVVADNRRFTIDVASDQLLTHSPPERISDARLLSHYYNNRAMELMLDGHDADAAAWLDKALQLDAHHASAWNNAGVLAQRSGDRIEAERNMLKALALNPTHSGALANIVAHYQRMGDTRNADAWRKRAEQARRNDPLHQFLLGHLAEKQGDYAVALERYRRAVKLDNNQSLFHLACARLWLRAGDIPQAINAMAQAQKLDSAHRNRYQAKLDKLRKLQR